jgi:uroporphyrinogen-III decarboxylase
MEKNWNDFTPDEKRSERFKRYLTPTDIKFSSVEAAENYRLKKKRMVDTYQMNIPDRVLVQLPIGTLPLNYAGITLKTAMYDYDALYYAWHNFLYIFDMDFYSGPGVVLPGRVYDQVGYSLYKLPGQGIPDDATGLQFVEGEYMKANEYDYLMRDPSDFWMRGYIPRIMSSLEPLRYLKPYTSMIEIATGFLAPYSRPEVQTALQNLIDTGKEMLKWQAVLAKCSKEAQEAGIPLPIGGSSARAPFDTLGDTMRGTQGIMKDIFRQPDKLIEAMDIIADISINTAIAETNANGGMIVGFPLHKGADGFMSDKQFEKFYWPSLKKVILGLINEGLIVSLFAEGSYNTRLETVNEFPRGSVIWRFDKTDMARAKKILGDKCCIAGNVPSSLISTGTPQAIKECCRRLIETCAPGGGYILTSGCSVEKAPPENLQAMSEAGKEYGVYS